MEMAAVEIAWMMAFLAVSQRRGWDLMKNDCDTVMRTTPIFPGTGFCKIDSIMGLMSFIVLIDAVISGIVMLLTAMAANLSASEIPAHSKIIFPSSMGAV